MTSEQDQGSGIRQAAEKLRGSQPRGNFVIRSDDSVPYPEYVPLTSVQDAEVDEIFAREREHRPRRRMPILYRMIVGAIHLIHPVNEFGWEKIKQPTFEQRLEAEKIRIAARDQVSKTTTEEQ